jgi:hypothetical protein
MLKDGANDKKKLKEKRKQIIYNSNSLQQSCFVKTEGSFSGPQVTVTDPCSEQN